MKDKGFKATQNGFTINLDNGYKLAFEQNSSSDFSKEVFVGIIDKDGVWHQDLAVIRNAYEYNNDNVEWIDEEFEVLVYSDNLNEDYTHHHTIRLYHEEDNDLTLGYKMLGRNGIWKIIKYPIDCAIYSKCSSCGFTHPCYKQDPKIISKTLYDADNEYNFCPKCGRPKMEVGNYVEQTYNNGTGNSGD